MSQTLYERLGGTEGITNLASDLVDNHLRNPRIAARFSATNVPKAKQGAATFFIAATGGPQVYEGQDMATVHKGMNISADELVAVMEDALEALARNNVGQRECEEVLFALFSMRGQIVRT